MVVVERGGDVLALGRSSDHTAEFVGAVWSPLSGDRQIRIRGGLEVGAAAFTVGGSFAVVPIGQIDEVGFRRRSLPEAVVWYLDIAC